ncbi:efflux RND transporter periplasmic adaptor subunit [Candidatus Desulforudis audaxviator]|uniref:efflux RND transporter periplasmic adaptor subunit n=1 Tax=Candidatus Desulforudis audaxviator TaxID=471827 RepID=UPI000300BEA6|nr:efflux RND transporter periplasmic adaptor subunit [Candidatus Desulforudis audaxviator]AZK60664.1 putative Co/Zn/Cd efflux system membrane fusion protein [Candidatus Desulforudis audaxviator]
MLGRRWLVLVVVLGLLFTLNGCERAGTEGQGKEGAAAVPVFVAQAEMGRLSRGDVLTGKVAPRTEVKLVPKMAGKVAAVTVDVGDRVRAGQTVVLLDAVELRAQLTQAEAGVAAAESGLFQAELAFKQAQADYERMKFLHDQGAIPDADFEKAELNFKLARDRAENLAPAQLQQARGQLEFVRANYNNATLTSPVSGLVAARNVNPGEMASPGVPVLTLIDIDLVRVEVNASEKLVNQIKVGQEVRVRVAAASAEPLTGKVVSIAPAADARARTYPVKVELPNPGHLLKAGMFAEVDFGTEADKNVLVPRDAVFQRSGAHFVFVHAGGRIELREVVPGPSDGRMVAVLKGLEAGEDVVVSGQEALEDGMKVQASRLEAKQ